ncbi:MAG TPA: hypothetical protein PLI74_12840 [Candidatus Kapabacteria bacterium]|nr:hypothetical protein [Candidatus Kapabacteria bacterium]
MQANKEFLEATIEDFDKLFEQQDIQNFLLSIISNDKMQSFKAYTLNRVIAARDAAHKVLDEYSNELSSTMKLYEFPAQMKELYDAAYSVRFFSTEFHEIISQSLQLYVEEEL